MDQASRDVLEHGLATLRSEYAKATDARARLLVDVEACDEKIAEVKPKIAAIERDLASG